MKIIGKPTINPILFYTGKVSGYFVLIILLLLLIGIDVIDITTFFYNRYIALILLITGVIITILSLFNLGNSVSLGIPSEKTSLKTYGLYEYSRNPMYLGFNLITISSMIYTLNIAVVLLGIYSIVVYHIIIKGEESFLKNRFGEEYQIYISKVRRYI
jgi:protein-S-isoprenylcysteine O-methyltransferase Ste14